MKIKLTSHQKSINTLLIIPATISIGLLSARIIYSESSMYVFLAWNLFLAFIPFYLSLAIASRSGNNNIPWFLVLIWLLFLPNAPYLLTDLIHLRIRTGVPYWYDIILVVSFCWNGLIIGFLSIYNVHEVIKQKKGEIIGWGLILLMVLLCGFGIYLGRYLRWNSWDIVTNPLELVQDIVNRIIHPFAHLRTWGITFSYSLFLLAGYLTIRSLIGWKIPFKEN